VYDGGVQAAHGGGRPATRASKRGLGPRAAIVAAALLAGTCGPWGAGQAGAAEPAAVAAAPAAGTRTPTAVFPLSGSAGAKSKKIVLAAIRAEVPRHGGAPTAAAQPLDESTEVLGCSAAEPVCLSTLARTLDVGALVSGSLDGAADAAGLHLRLRVANARGTTVAEGTFELPDGKGLAAAARAAAADLLARAAVAAYGRLAVRTDPPGAAVVVDGADRGTTPLALDLAAGNYTVEVRLGATSAMRRVDLTPAGAEVTIDLRAPGGAAGAGAGAGTGTDAGAGAAPSTSAGLGAAGGGAVAGGAAADGEGGAGAGKGGATGLSHVGAPGVTAGGAGVALLAGGVVFAVLTAGTQHRFDDGVAALPPPESGDADLATLRDLDRMNRRGKAFALLADALFVTGGVAVAAGALLVWLDLRHGARPDPSAAPAPAVSAAPTARVSAGLVAGRPGVALEVAW
jgi:hypothetical protein